MAGTMLDYEGKRLLKLLIEVLQGAAPGKPQTYITYQEVHRCLGLTLNGVTYGRSLQAQGLSSLAQWVMDMDFPAITGLIVDGANYSPGDGYFTFYGKEKDPYRWWEEQILLSKKFDWLPYISENDCEGLNTRYFVFNIGKPYTDDWWRRNIDDGIITAGFKGISGDRGDHILNAFNEGDWVLAYANGCGYVGAGFVGQKSSYKLVAKDQLPDGWESNHRHIRNVDWLYAVKKMNKAVQTSVVQANPPRHTKQRMAKEIAVKIIEILASRSEIKANSKNQLKKEFDDGIHKSINDRVSERRKRLSMAAKKPPRVAVISYEFVRNPDVVAEVLYLANGICSKCKSKAPFRKRRDGSPYLEVHHKIPLAENGEDTVENAIALCPNCHRESHFG